jgi:hypothetical protein
MQDTPPDAELEHWLKTLGIASLCQWDVLVFLYRHQTALVGADHLARLLGYATELAVAALDGLDSLGLVVRSRVSQGARLYQFTVPPEPPRREAFNRLLALVGHRAGRLRLSKQLRRERSPQERLEAPRHFRDEAPQVVRVNESRPRDLGERRETWRKAI